MMTPDDKLIQSVAKDIMGRSLTGAEMSCVKLLFFTGQIGNSFRKLSKDKQNELKKKYGNLLVKYYIA